MTQEEYKHTIELLIKALSKQLDSVAQVLIILQIDPEPFFELKLKDLKESKAEAKAMMAKLEQNPPSGAVQ